MSRLLARSSRAFMRGVLGNMTLTTQTPFTVIRDAVAADEGEHDPVRKTLAVMVKQKHAEVIGEGDTATYKLTASGEELLNALGGN